MCDSKGMVLADAVAAMALLALAALGVTGLGHGAIVLAAQARDLDHARMAARSTLEELHAVPFVALPETFSVSGSASRASMSTFDGSAPADWMARIDGLTVATLTAQVEGLDGAGRLTAMEQAIALRLTVTVDYSAFHGPRTVRLVGARF